MAGEPGTLWIVATPIGTLGDLSPRALEVLSAVELILAEDTRRARALLSHFQVPSGGGRLQSLHEHNENAKVSSLMEVLNSGKSVALMSDAGTPVLSDPGFLLVREARRSQLPVRSVPGPSSFTAAIAASGQPPLPAILCGFLPSKPGARLRRIEELAQFPWTLVVLLFPHRLARELTDLAKIFGEHRKATLLAEISKLHERARFGSLGEIASDADVDHPRGEYVLVVGPLVSEGTQVAADADEVRRRYEDALSQGMARPEAMRETARRFGIRRREVFAILVDGDDSNNGE